MRYIESFKSINESESYVEKVERLLVELGKNISMINYLFVAGNAEVDKYFDEAMWMVIGVDMTELTDSYEHWLYSMDFECDIDPDEYPKYQIDERLHLKSVYDTMINFNEVFDELLKLYTRFPNYNIWHRILDTKEEISYPFSKFDNLGKVFQKGKDWCGNAIQNISIYLTQDKLNRGFKGINEGVMDNNVELFDIIKKIDGNIWICGYRSNQGILYSVSEVLKYNGYVTWDMSRLTDVYQIISEIRKVGPSDVEYIILNRVDRHGREFYPQLTELFLLTKRSPSKKLIFLSGENTEVLDKEMIMNQFNLKKIDLKKLYDRTNSVVKDMNK